MNSRLKLLLLTFLMLPLFLITKLGLTGTMVTIFVMFEIFQIYMHFTHKNHFGLEFWCWHSVDAVMLCLLLYSIKTIFQKFKKRR